MPTWEVLQDQSDIDQLAKRSFQQPCLIFKHSTRCSISAFAKHRLEKSWDFDHAEMTPYFLDLIQYRSASNYVAEKFGIQHESPQLLLIRDGACVYHASHLDIGAHELRGVLTKV
ncbi:MAG: bacillithiol system redox-active protein YtxJ [Lewinella sp.]|nr:bacillithiol system redox-active protein YtxJ [Lewinella sp.]